MKVLWTGSCGFIMSNCIIYSLQETDWDLISIDKLTYAGSLKNVPQVKRHKLYVGDICDKHFVNKVFEVEEPEIVVHGAAESSVDNSIQNSDDFVLTNVVGTHNILDASLKSKTVKRVINISTDEVYGSIDSGSFDEKCKLNPRNPYAASKAAADLLGQSYFHTYGLPIITTRCSNNFGSRQHQEKFIPKVISSILAKKKIPIYGNGKNRREWIYVKDNFSAIKTIIENGKVGEVYNISTNQEKENIEIVKLILNLMGADEKLIEYVKDRQGHDFRYSVDCSKLINLGWKARYNFDEAISHTIGWYKANQWALK